MNQLLFWSSYRITSYNLHSMLYRIWYEVSAWLMFLEHIISNDGQSFNELIWPSLLVMCWRCINLRDIISYAELICLNGNLANEFWFQYGKGIDTQFWIKKKKWIHSGIYFFIRSVYIWWEIFLADNTIMFLQVYFEEMYEAMNFNM